jgi:hypothetical protein
VYWSLFADAFQNGRPFIIVREQGKKVRTHGLEAIRVCSQFPNRARGSLLTDTEPHLGRAFGYVFECGDGSWDTERELGWKPEEEWSMEGWRTGPTLAGLLSTFPKPSLGFYSTPNVPSRLGELNCVWMSPA